MNIKTIAFSIMTTLLAISLSACSSQEPVIATPTQPAQTGPEVFDMVNPASAYCEQQGYQVEMHTDASGGQVGICRFDDGSTCDEWAYFRGECGPESTPGDGISVTPAAQAFPVTAWAGHVASAPDGSEGEMVLDLLPAGTGQVRVSGATQEIEKEIRNLVDGSGVKQAALFWGSLSCDSSGEGACVLSTTKVRYGQFQERDIVESWEGSVVCSYFNSSPTATCGNAFVLSGDFPVQFGLWSADVALLQEIEGLRDSGKQVRVWGQILAGVPDVNGTQIQVEKLEMIQEADG
jgi:putative hemolysin